MKPARIAVLGAAILAGAAAFMLLQNPSAPPAPVEIAAGPSIKTTEVLVAAVDVPMGQTLKVADLRWQSWPDDGLPAGYVRRSDSASALQETAGSIVRSDFLSGEPIRREKLIKADGGGFMSAILPSGMRALAINIDTRGSTSAGGFILPNDRVDVIRTFRDEESARSGGESTLSETVLSNIRVLAIGQNIQERNGEKVVTGETATLELSPQQVETIALAQKVGQLSLSLRSLADAKQTAEAPLPEKAESGLTVVRYGVSKQTSKR
jgi:pilus assembly protein CpaB